MKRYPLLLGLIILAMVIAVFMGSDKPGSTSSGQPQDRLTTGRNSGTPGNDSIQRNSHLTGSELIDRATSAQPRLAKDTTDPVAPAFRLLERLPQPVIAETLPPGEPIPAAVRALTSSTLIDPDSLDSLALLQKGDPVSFPAPEGGWISGEVTYREIEAETGRLVIAGQLAKRPGHYFSAFMKDGEVAATLLLPDERRALRVQRAGDGRLLLQEKPIDSVICIGMPNDQGPGGPPPIPQDSPLEPISVPLRDSRPDATAVLYLDFDGETVEDPTWLAGATIVAQPAILDGHRITSEEIEKVWEMVSEDFRPFDVSVTTDLDRYMGANPGKRLRCVITPTDAVAPNSGGIAWIGSFSTRIGGPNYDLFSANMLCWCFNSHNTSVMAMTISHEVGHTLGLYHDGLVLHTVPNSYIRYYAGHGSGDTGWGPIMGGPFTVGNPSDYKQLTQWTRGEYSDYFNEIPGWNGVGQDELAIIARMDTNGFGYVEDDVGDSMNSSKIVAGISSGVIDEEGMIHKSDDVDCYHFTTGGGMLNVTCSPNPIEPNLNTRLELRDSAGILMAESSPDGVLTSSISQNLPHGGYFLMVKSQGEGTPMNDPPTGFTAYGSLGNYHLAGNFVPGGVGSLDPSFDSSSVANHYFRSLAIQPDDKVLVGGPFTTYNNIPRKGTARLNANGTIDNTFEANLGTANAAGGHLTIQPDGKVLTSVGYEFESPQGSILWEGGVVQLNADGSFASDFGRARRLWWEYYHPATTTTWLSAPVYCLELQPDGKLLVGGSFTQFNGSEHSGIVRLHTNGNVDSSFTALPINPEVPMGPHEAYSMALQPDGEVILGGEFRLPIYRRVFARLDSDGSLDFGFNPDVPRTGLYMAEFVLQPDGKIFASGKRFNPNGSLDTSFAPAVNLGDVFALQADGKVLVNGSDASGPKIRRLNADGSLDPTFFSYLGANYSSNNITSLSLQGDGRVVIGTHKLESGQSIGRVVRLINDPAILNLEATSPGRVEWLRGGSAPEVAHVTFENSPDGMMWTPLGPGTRIAGGWEITGLNLPGAGHLRARGRSAGRGSGSIYEQTATYGLADIAVSGNEVDIACGDNTPGSWDHTALGSAPVDGGFGIRVFTIENRGDVPLNLDGEPHVALSGLHAADFTVVEQPGNLLAAGDSTTFAIRFAPLALGTRVATVSIASDDDDEDPFVFSIQGQGVVPPDLTVPTVAITTPATDGTIVNSADLTLTGTASDNIAVNLVSARINGGDWTAATGTTDWSATVTLSAGINTIEARSRDASGNFSAIGVRSVIYQTAPELDLQLAGGSPLANGNVFQFGQVRTGVTKDQQLTILNTGTAELRNLTLTLDGADAGQFRFVGSLPNPVIAQGQMANFTIRFAPTSSGLKSGAVVITSNDADENPFRVELSGTANGPEILISQASYHGGAPELIDGAVTGFGDCLPNGSGSRMFTVANEGTDDLSGVVVSVTGAHSGDFTLQLAELPTVIHPGQRASFGVTFAPGSEGQRSVILNITSNDTDEGTLTLGLEGTGIVIPPPFVQQAYLKAPATDRFGGLVAMSGDTLAVTAWGDNEGPGQAGAVFVFVRNGESWIKQATIKAPSPVAGSSFGNSLALSDDTLIIGAPGEANFTGAAYVFVRVGTQWIQDARIVPANSDPGDWFGGSVGVSNGTAVIVASSEDSGAIGVNGDQSDNSAPNTGAAYVFVKSGSGWTQQAYLKPKAGGYMHEVAISDHTIAVGNWSEDGDAGGVYVFARNDGEWSQQAYLKGSNTDEDDYFGTYLSLSGDTLAVGAPGEDSASTGVNGDGIQSNEGSYSGSAYIFKRTGTTWTQEAFLKPSTYVPWGWFGPVCVAGNTVVVGAESEASNALGTNGNQADTSASDSGAAYVFTREAGTWSQRAYLKASNTDSGDYFGTSVAVANGTVAVGATWESSDATGINGNQANNRARASGAVYLFNQADPPESIQQWATFAGLAGADASPGATPFDDGVPNLLKFAFNMNGGGPDVGRLQPGTGTSGLPFVGLAGEGSASVLRVEFIRRKDSGLIYTPKRSSTLAPGSFVPMTGTPVVTPIPFTDEQWERVVVEDPVDFSLTPRAFVTVEVTIPE